MVYLPPGIRRKNNGFEVRVYAGIDPLTGKQRQISRMAKTIAEAKKLKRELDQQVAEAGRNVPKIISALQNEKAARAAEKIRLAKALKATEAGRSPKTYFIYSPITDQVKIGRSIDPFRRCNDLVTVMGMPLLLLAVVGEDVENELHRRFRAYRTIGEWFKWSQDIRDYIAKITEAPLPRVRARLKRADAS